MLYVRFNTSIHNITQPQLIILIDYCPLIYALSTQLNVGINVVASAKSQLLSLTLNDLHR